MKARLHPSQPFKRKEWAGILGVLALLAGGVGCGTPGLPRPPSLGLPEPLTGLSAARSANSVKLTWTTPRLSTDKLALPAEIHARICRAVGGQPCIQVGEQDVDAGKPAQFEDRLPPQLASGDPQLLTYTVELTNHAGHSAGRSNAAYSASGAAPAPLQSLTAEMRADGVLLHWQPSGDQAGKNSVRIYRTLLSGPAESPKPANPLSTGPGKKRAISDSKAASGAELPEPSVLLVPVGVVGEADGRAVDALAAFDSTYTYSAERVRTLRLDGHDLTVAGDRGGPVTLVTRDVFPPAVPGGLVALAVPEEHAIDLSWTPDREPDLAGYFVYRREAGGAEDSSHRISPDLVTAPSFRDPTAVPGRKYTYAISAVDADGNESHPSPSVEEGLPQ